jgi:hypothetical protein
VTALLGSREAREELGIRLEHGQYDVLSFLLSSGRAVAVFLPSAMSEAERSEALASLVEVTEQVEDQRWVQRVSEGNSETP